MDELPLLICPLNSEEPCGEVFPRIEAFYRISLTDDASFNNSPLNGIRRELDLVSCTKGSVKIHLNRGHNVNLGIRSALS